MNVLVTVWKKKDFMLINWNKNTQHMYRAFHNVLPDYKNLI